MECLFKVLQHTIMSPEPNPVKLFETNSTDFQDCNSDITTATKGESVEESTFVNDNNEKPKQTDNGSTTSLSGDALLKPPIAKRERRNVSPSLNDAFPDPMSPSSCSSTSQATSANDTTFEPTVEMMVNDFDDEQTLNEEEALAALESQDPNEEINTLKEESEIPIEDLLAKYQALPTMPFTEQHRRKAKKSAHKKKHKSKQKVDVLISEKNVVPPVEILMHEEVLPETSNPVDIGKDTQYESSDEKDMQADEDNDLMDVQPAVQIQEKIKLNGSDEQRASNTEKIKVRRTHLLDLYPEGTFENVVVKEVITANGKEIPLETLYGEEDEEDEEVEEEDEEDFKKKVMIGATYQAIIPHGLSQYGDILPYENEDKLIWEPSQVSEKEVEEYLIKIREIKSNLSGEEDLSDSADNTVSVNKTNGHGENNQDNLENDSLLANGERRDAVHNYSMSNNGNVEYDAQSAVVKDNEQALHLLVQCGYDFKEALRRKRLNALPLNDCMSLWSEEECQKFEEGIQKYGKDFLKIRQIQVRTRTMRELVQFYYLWKKSERRDQNFANADTVDHMDIYLNEDNDYGSNPACISTPIASPVGNCTTSGSARRNNSTAHKNISIMSNASAIIGNPTSTQPTSTDKSVASPQQQQQKRRCSGNSNNILGNIDVTNNDSSVSNTTTTLTISLVK